MTSKKIQQFLDEFIVLVEIYAPATIEDNELVYHLSEHTINQLQDYMISYYRQAEENQEQFKKEGHI